MIRRHALASLRMLLVLTLLLGAAYPLAVTGIAQLAMADRTNGSLLEADGRVVGSRLLGQRFSGPEWFHGRPDPFDPAASGATNLGPSNPKLLSEVERRVAEVEEEAPPGVSIPPDAVTGSGSGLDPHISLAHARLQAPGVARARGLPPGEVQALIDRFSEGRTFGFLGEPRVNVLELNLALARRSP